jgi:hypothetical protein
MASALRRSQERLVISISTRVRSGPNGKGGRRFRQPPCRRTFDLALTTGGSARLHVGGMLGPRRQGKRASRPGQRSANASRWPSPYGKPFGGCPQAASRLQAGHRGGGDPEGSASHLDVLCSTFALRHRLRGFGHPELTAPKDHRVSMASPGSFRPKASLPARLVIRPDRCRNTCLP